MRIVLLATTLLFASACDAPVNGDEDCAVVFDKCNSGCTPLCVSVAEGRRIDKGEQCDLGCDVVSGGSGDSAQECIAVEGECVWSE